MNSKYFRLFFRVNFTIQRWTVLRMELHIQKPCTWEGVIIEDKMVMHVHAFLIYSCLVLIGQRSMRISLPLTFLNHTTSFMLMTFLNDEWEFSVLFIRMTTTSYRQYWYSVFVYCLLSIDYIVGKCVSCSTLSCCVQWMNLQNIINIPQRVWNFARQPAEVLLWYIQTLQNGNNTNLYLPSEHIPNKTGCFWRCAPYSTYQQPSGSACCKHLHIVIMENDNSITENAKWIIKQKGTQNCVREVSFADTIIILLLIIASFNCP